MCFSSRKTPDIQMPAAPPIAPAPKIAPLPSPSPTETPSAVTAQQRREKIANLRFGLLSTIRTSPRGITGTGANLATTGAGKKKLGE